MLLSAPPPQPICRSRRLLRRPSRSPGYVGGNVGGAFSYDKIRSSDDFSSAGFIGGGQVGYYDFGDNAFTLVDNINGVSVLGSLKDRIHTVTAGLNYHF